MSDGVPSIGFFIVVVFLVCLLKWRLDVIDARREAAEKKRRADAEWAADFERRTREAVQRRFEAEARFQAYASQQYLYEQMRAQMNADFSPQPQSQWRVVLGITDPRPTRDEISRAYRSKAKLAHPDHGGTTEAMARLNAAKRQALLETPA